jgi:hypothetical protein
MAVERTKTEVAEIISAFLSGDGFEWSWDDFISVRIKDSSLEAIRAQCATLPDEYPSSVPGQYCGEDGIAVLRSFVKHLRFGSV